MSTRYVPTIGRLTLDDLEALAHRYGGTIEQNTVTGRCKLVGAFIDGRTVTLGPVPGPVRLVTA